MKFPKPKTFRGATSPTTIARWAFGVGTFEYPAGHPQHILSVCWSVAWLITVLISARMAMLENMWSSESYSVTWTSYYIIMTVRSINNIVIIYRGYAGSEKYQHCLFKLDRVNETLNKLGISEGYELIFKSQVVNLIVISLVALVMISTYIGATVFINYSSVGLVSYLICSIYHLVTNLIEEYTFRSCIRYIGERFKLLNALLIKSGMDAENMYLSNVPSNHQDGRHHIPWLLPPALDIHPRYRYVAIAHNQWIMARRVHYDLRDIAENLNEIFGLQILLSAAIAFCMVTVLIFDLYNLLFVSTKHAGHIAYLLMIYFIPMISCYTLRVFGIISICSTTSTEAQLTGELIYEVITPITCHEIREEIYAFSLQLMEDHLRFTACGFFPLDYTTIYGMMGTLITYLIVMIQASTPAT